MKKKSNLEKLNTLIFFFLRLFFFQIKFSKIRYKMKKIFNKIIFSDDLSEISPFVTESFLRKPLIYVPIVEEYLNKVYFKFIKKKPTVTFDLKKSLKEKFISPRNLKIEFINEIIFIEGLVIYFSETKLKIKSPVFFCSLTHKLFIPRNTNKLKKHNLTGRRFIKSPLRLDYRFSEFISYQYIIIQDLPCQIPIENFPRQILVTLKDELVNSCRMGQNIKLCGIYNFPEILKLNFKKIFTGGVVNCLSISSNEKYALLKNLKCDIILIKNFSLIFDNFNRLVSMVVPCINYQILIKKGIIFFLVNDNYKKKLKNINVLLAGDFDIYKNTFFQFIVEFYTETLLINFKDIQNTDNSDSVLNFSLISNNKLICISGLERLSEFGKILLNDILEYQKIMLPIEECVYTTKTKCKLFANAASIFTKYNCKKSIQSNINLQKFTILKFDLVFLLLDYINKKKDKKIATKLINCGYISIENFILPKKEESKKKKISMDFFKLFINFCKNVITPYFNDKAVDFVLKDYKQVKKRKEKQSTRYIESLLKITLIYVKINLRLMVKKKDIEVINRYLIEVAQTNRMALIKFKKKKKRKTHKPVYALIFFSKNILFYTGKKIYFLKRYFFYTKIGTIYDHRLIFLKIKKMFVVKKTSLIEKTIFEWIIGKKCLIFKKILLKI